MNAKPLIVSVTIILTVLVMIVSYSHASEKKAYTPKEKEELYGTWINKEYDKRGENRHYKVVMTPEELLSYDKTFAQHPAWVATYAITDKWTDSKGNAWYKITWRIEISELSGTGLIRISNSGSTREAVYSYTGEYPTKID